MIESFQEFSGRKFVRTWNCDEQADISRILNGFETSLSLSPISQSVISPLVEPTAEYIDM